VKATGGVYLDDIDACLLHCERTKEDVSVFTAAHVLGKVGSKAPLYAVVTVGNDALISGGEEAFACTPNSIVTRVGASVAALGVKRSTISYSHILALVRISNASRSSSIPSVTIASTYVIDFVYRSLESDVLVRMAITRGRKSLVLPRSPVFQELEKFVRTPGLPKSFLSELYERLGREEFSFANRVKDDILQSPMAKLEGTWDLLKYHRGDDGYTQFHL